MKKLFDKPVEKIKEIYRKKIDPIKESVKGYINEDDFEKIEVIIHSAATSAAAASAAMAQGAAFGLDTPVLIAIHSGMIITLGEVFGRKLNKVTAEALLGAAAGIGIGVFGVKAILGFVPIGGNIVNAAISFSYTEFLGWIFVKYFKGDTDLPIALNIQGDLPMKTEQHFAGPVGQVVGQAKNSIFQQLQIITDDLSKVKDEMQKNAHTPEQQEAAEEMAKAEQAARENDQPKMMKHLKNAGKWALETAKEIGTEVTVKVIKESLGI